jgi:hypothetical protein
MNGFGGINKGTSRVEISETESPDAVNCFFHDGRIGVLGARKGKTFVNATKYPEDVVGFMPFLLPSGTQKNLVGTLGGDVIQTSTNNGDGVTNYVTGVTATGKAMSTSTLTLSHPATSAALLTTFADASSYDPNDSLFVSWGWGIAMTSTGTWTSATKVRIEMGINESGVAKYLWTFDWTMQFDHAWSLTGLTPAALHNASNSITGMCARISWPGGAWPTGAAGGDSVTLSSLLMG